MRQVDAILAALATRLSTAPGLQGADAFFADRMGALPRAICAWMGGPVEMKMAGLVITKHNVDIFVVIAPRASLTMSAKAMSEVVRNTAVHLMGDITLSGSPPGPPACTQMKVTGIRPTSIGLGGETYMASVISVEIEDKGAEAIA